MQLCSRRPGAVQSRRASRAAATRLQPVLLGASGHTQRASTAELRASKAEPGPSSLQASSRRAARPPSRSVSVRALADDDVVRVASVGDMVTIHFRMTDAKGQVLEDSRQMQEPLTFEVGAGDMMGNQLFQGFDEAVRGMAVGQTTELEASGGEWQRELLFSVPEDHPEIQRLQGRYKSQGGLKEGMLVELANGNVAMILAMKDGAVQIDANNMMAGQRFTFVIEILSIEMGPGAESKTA